MATPQSMKTTHAAHPPTIEHTNADVKMLLKMFPQIDDPTYAEEVIEHFRRIGYSNPLGPACPWLSDQFRQMKKREAPEITPFEQFHKSFVPSEMTPYHRLCLMYFQQSYPFVSPQILFDAFKLKLRLFIPTGTHLQSHLDVDSTPPTYEGKPITLLPMARDPPKLQLTDPHFSHDLALIKDNDRATLYLETIDNQGDRFARFPKLPQRVGKTVEIGSDPLQLTCDICRAKHPYNKFVGCSSDHLHCPDCFYRAVDRAVAEKEVTVRCILEDGSKRDEGRCSAVFNEETVMEKLTIEEIKRLKDPVLPSKFPFDTIRSGICANCYFPLRREASKPHTYVCTSDACKKEFFVI